MKEDVYRYKAGVLKTIAEDYEDYTPNAQLPDNWMDAIEFKCDFDCAASKLNKAEKRLVFDTETWKIGQRNEVFKKMTRFLNGEV